MLRKVRQCLLGLPRPGKAHIGCIQAWSRCSEACMAVQRRRGAGRLGKGCKCAWAAQQPERTCLFFTRLPHHRPSLSAAPTHSASESFPPPALCTDTAAPPPRAPCAVTARAPAPRRARTPRLAPQGSPRPLPGAGSAPPRAQPARPARRTPPPAPCRAAQHPCGLVPRPIPRPIAVLCADSTPDRCFVRASAHAAAAAAAGASARSRARPGLGGAPPQLCLRGARVQPQGVGVRGAGGARADGVRERRRDGPHTQRRAWTPSTG